MRLLEKHAGLRPARVKTVRRQKEEGYRNAVQLIADGELEKGYQPLDSRGYIQEVNNDSRHHLIAAEYVQLRGERKSCLQVSPTHSEGSKLTDHIRSKLKDLGELRKNEGREVLHLKNLNWTEAEKSVASTYRKDLVVQVHKNIPGGNFRRGDRGTIASVDGETVKVRVKDRILSMPLADSQNFSVFEQRRIELCPGERIKITSNGKTIDGKSVNNGDIFTLRKVRANGEIVLAGERKDLILSADYGHLAYGYYSTSHASQGDTVDYVLLAQSDQSLGKAASAEQFNVSVSRGRHRVTIYTDDKEELLDAILHSSARQSAHDILSVKQRQRLMSLKQNPPGQGIVMASIPPFESVHPSDTSTTEIEIEI